MSNRSHYIGDYGPRNYYGLGRLHNVSMWKNNTDLVSWGVQRRFVERITNYINTRYDEEKASFLSSRLLPIDQIVLERQLLTIAHAHTNDRANALLVGSLLISDLPKFNVSSGNITIGQLLLHVSALYDMSYAMVVSFDANTTEISYLTLHMATRQTRMNTYPLTASRVLIQKYVPDVEITDMAVLAQLIADGNLLDQPPRTTATLQRSVKKLITRAVHVTPEEQIQNQIFAEKHHQLLDHESRAQ